MLQSFHPFPQGFASIFHETSQVPSFDRKTISWVIVGKKKIIITITIITLTVITRNVSNKHSPVQSGSSSDRPQQNWSIINWSSVYLTDRNCLKQGGQCCRLFSFQLHSAALCYGLLENVFQFHAPLCSLGFAVEVVPTECSVQFVYLVLHGSRGPRHFTHPFGHDVPLRSQGFGFSAIQSVVLFIGAFAQDGGWTIVEDGRGFYGCQAACRDGASTYRGVRFGWTGMCF